MLISEYTDSKEKDTTDTLVSDHPHTDASELAKQTLKTSIEKLNSAHHLWSIKKNLLLLLHLQILMKLITTNILSSHEMHVHLENISDNDKQTSITKTPSLKIKNNSFLTTQPSLDEEDTPSAMPIASHTTNTLIHHS